MHLAKFECIIQKSDFGECLNEMTQTIRFGVPERPLETVVGNLTQVKCKSEKKVWWLARQATGDCGGGRAEDWSSPQVTPPPPLFKVGKEKKKKDERKTKKEGKKE